MESIGVQLCGADDVRFTFGDGESMIVDRAIISRSSILSDMVLSIDSYNGEVLQTPHGYLPAWLEMAAAAVSELCSPAATADSLIFSMRVRQAADLAAVVFV